MHQLIIIIINNKNGATRKVNQDDTQAWGSNCIPHNGCMNIFSKIIAFLH